jgi:hypothetical protein
VSIILRPLGVRLEKLEAIQRAVLPISRTTIVIECERLESTECLGEKENQDRIEVGNSRFLTSPLPTGVATRKSPLEEASGMLRHCNQR